EAGLARTFADAGVTATVVRQGSALCVYFMDHAPVDWHDIATHHDFDFDLLYRRRLLGRGVFQFPMPTKQVSLSTAHTPEHIAETLHATRDVLAELTAA